MFRTHPFGRWKVLIPFCAVGLACAIGAQSLASNNSHGG